MSDQHLTYLTAPTLPLYQLTTPPLEKEAKEIILKHSCRVEEQESLEKCVIFFPEGTTKTEIFPRTTHPRYQIKLPDGYELRETYDRYQETSLLSYSPE